MSMWLNPRNGDRYNAKILPTSPFILSLPSSIISLLHLLTPSLPPSILTLHPSSPSILSLPPLSTFLHFLPPSSPFLPVGLFSIYSEVFIYPLLALTQSHGFQEQLVGFVLIQLFNSSVRAWPIAGPLSHFLTLSHLLLPTLIRK